MSTDENASANDPLTYRIANLEDCESLSLLVNSAYRGESSRQGWTTEEALLGGQRIDIPILTDLINDPQNIILVFFDPTDETLVGCVHLQHKSEVKTAHLGMFTVRPTLQAKGYGKFIMSVAENYAINHWNAEKVEMDVITQRPELIAYYNRRGYLDIGTRKPLPTDVIKYSIPKRDDLEFCVLQKYVKKT